jgi:hypothetical protein
MTPGTPLNPRIINRADPAADAPSPPTLPQAAPPEAPAKAREDSPRLAAIASAAAKQATAPPQPSLPGESSDKLIRVSLTNAVASPAATILVAAAGLLTLVLATFAWLRRHERTQLAGAASRDFASVSLGDAGKRDSGAAEHVLAVVNAAPVAPHRRPPHTTSMPSARGPSHWGDAIPRSREDALQVLGIGVTPDASETALKKIVDGLRLSWHPDYAKDADDLRLRELRLKQINAAWEIIAGKRVDA